jgi:hypothetical protein
MGTGAARAARAAPRRLAAVPAVREEGGVSVV